MNNDLISRSALKEAFEDLFYNDVDDQERTERLIDNAPTVEAFTENDKALAYCEGYVRGSHEAYIRPQGDLISRQDAIDALEGQLDYLQTLNKNENPTAEGKWYGVNWARNTIADLPYKQNERPKGEWKPDMDSFYCDQCGVTALEINRKWYKSNFCPNCGADMRGE